MRKVILIFALAGCSHFYSASEEKSGTLDGKRITALRLQCKPNKGVEYYILPPKLGVRCKNSAIFWEETK